MIPFRRAVRSTCSRFRSIACGVSLTVSFSTAFAEQNLLHRALESIRTEDLKAHVDVLADDTFEGREAGSRGGRAASHYLLKKCEQYRLKPLGEGGGYLQVFSNGYRNVLGMMEGSDPQLKHEAILIGAHYDHVGYGTRQNSYGPYGLIHNGADDNASGVAALLETIEALRELPNPPKRSIVFAFWDGEEKGLLGSKHWAAQPTLPWSHLKAAVNIDMVGRLTQNRLEVYGARTSAGSRRMLSRSNDTSAMELDFSWKMQDDSDHWTFFARGTPVVMFHTGLHGDYHRPSDDAHLVNLKGMQEVTRLLVRYTYELADADKLPSFRQESRNENVDTKRMLEATTSGPAPRLGMTWRKRETKDGGLIAVNVYPGSAAEKAGLRFGDVITHLDSAPIRDEALFRLQVLAAAQPLKLTFVRAAGEPQETTVTLQGKPIQWGITWRSDRGEPGTYLITHLVYGSPADIAGLRVGDRLYDWDGRELRDDVSFAAALAEARDTVPCRYERRGRIAEATLKSAAQWLKDSVPQGEAKSEVDGR